MSGDGGLPNALVETKSLFSSASARVNAKRAVVIIQDKPTGLTVTQLQDITRPLVDEGVVVVGVGNANSVPLSDERALTIINEDAMIVYQNETAGSLSDRIVRRILKGKWLEFVSRTVIKITTKSMQQMLCVIVNLIADLLCSHLLLH